MKWTADIVLDPIDFDGDKVVFTVGRLVIEDMGVILKHFNKDTGMVEFGSLADFSAVATEIVPKYVKSISGLTHPDGRDVTSEEFCKEMANQWYFSPLVGKLFTFLMGASSVKAQDEKNSESPQPVPPTESGDQSSAG